MAEVGQLAAWVIPKPRRMGEVDGRRRASAAPCPRRVRERGAKNPWRLMRVWY